MWFYRVFLHKVQERVMNFRYYHLSRQGVQKPQKQILVMRVDGRQYHGGLCDRFKGAVSSYAWCKQRGIEFRLLYNYPFELTDYLVPAGYDWRLKEGELSSCARDVRVIYHRGEHGERMLKLHTDKQIHFYGNINFLPLLNQTGGTDYSWGGLFQELFKPSTALQSHLDRLKTQIGGDYSAAVFRFQNLLGDFPEYNFKPLQTEREREALIEKCIEATKKFHAEQAEGQILLVTSDSEAFLKRVSQLDKVFIIPGSLIHVDGGGAKAEAEAKAEADGQPKTSVDIAGGTVNMAFMKSFLDFFMIAGAQRVACIGTDFMYPSQFPQYAAKIHDIPFERIVI